MAHRRAHYCAMKRTCTFQSILFAVARGRGMRPTAEGIPVDVAETLAEGITEAYAECVKFRDWPEALELEELTVETDPDSTLPYLPRMLQSGILLHTVHGIWDKHPAEPGARALPYRLEPSGYYLRACDGVSAGGGVWVKYRTDSPKFSAIEFDIGERYPAGNVVYDSETGHCYLALQNTEGYPVTDTTRWRPQPLLDLLRLAVIAGATAHFLRSEGQDQTARGYEIKMQDRLETEALLIIEGEQQQQTYRSH
jgi:hypothetical protein